MNNRQRLDHVTFINICEAAIAKDLERLRGIPFQAQMSGQGISNYTPMCFLAMKGHDSAVQFLLEKFLWDIFDAIDGYLRVGRDDKAKELITIAKKSEEHEHFTRSLIQTYAANGRTELVNAMLQDHPNQTSFALKGYIIGKHQQLADELLRRAGVSLEHAAVFYAMAGDTAKIADMFQLMIAAGRNRNSGDVIDMLESYGHFDTRYGILSLITQTRDTFLREQIATAVRIRHPEYDDKELLKTADQINQLMDKYALTFDQAKAFTSETEMTWLLQGQKFSATPLPMDVFIHITTYVTQCSNKEARTLFQLLSRKIHERALNSADKKFAPGKFSSLFSCLWPKHHNETLKKLEEKKDDINNKYDESGRRLGSRK